MKVGPNRVDKAATGCRKPDKKENSKQCHIGGCIADRVAKLCQQSRAYTAAFNAIRSKREVPDRKYSTTLDRIGRKCDEPENEGEAVQKIRTPSPVHELSVGCDANERRAKRRLEIPNDLLGVRIGHPKDCHHRKAKGERS